MSDAEIKQTAPAELPIFPAEFWDEATIQVPSPKKAISLRVDEEVLAWFKSKGPRYQTRMNAILRSYVLHMRRQGSEKRRPSKRLQETGAKSQRSGVQRVRRSTSLRSSKARRGGARR